MAIWDQREGEPDEWYARFRAYLSLGPQRTVAAAHSFVVDLVERMPLGQVRWWQHKARRYEWKERAAAFDAEQGQRGLGGDERLRMVVELLHQVYGALRNADIPALSKEEVRQLLPTFRLFFHDLLKFHQGATAHLLADQGMGEGDVAQVSADEMSEMMKDADVVQQMHRSLKLVVDAASHESAWLPLREVLSRLYADEVSARRIAAQAQLEIARIHFGSSALDRWHAILTEAVHTGAMGRVIEAARHEYGGNEELKKAVRAYHEWRG